MTSNDGRLAWNGWRIARWSAVAILLLIPAVMMRIIPDWNWGPGGFVLAAIVIGGPVLLYEVAAMKSSSSAYGIGAALALATAFLTIWTTIVHDDGNGIGFFTLVLAAAVGAFAARFRADGMARAMLGTAGLQVFLGMMIATAPSTATAPGGVASVLAMSGFFMLFWLISAASFHAAGKARA